jgi:hypothetical protein
MRVLATLASIVLSVWLCISPGYAEKRVALVIGNDAYSNLPADQQLRKAVNDARAVGHALRGIGFQVIHGENLGRQALLAKFDELTQRLEPGDMAFFFFAGHGVAVGGGNYILPADVPDLGPGQDMLLVRTSLGENDIVSDLQGRGARVAIVVLDACRNNPFKKPGVRAVGSDRGLGRIEPARGVFTLYSAGIGQMALDGLGNADENPNSVFTRVFVPALERPGVDLKEMATEVREEVARLASSVQHDQRPAYYDETIGGRVYLAGLPQEEKPSNVRPADPCAAAADHWRSTEAIGNLAAFEDHLVRFPNCTFAGLAKTRIENLKSKVAVGVAASPEQDVDRFDGFWTVTLVCPKNPSLRLPGWAFQLSATVKNGNFRGLRGVEGKPGGEVFDGTIDPDGTTRIFVNGLSRDTASDPFHRPTGTKFQYAIAGKLEGSRGRGSRVDRNCDVTFAKK